MELMELAKGKDLLRPYGHTDVLLYYGIVGQKLLGWLKGKELAGKVWIPNGPQILKRGSKLTPLWIEEFVSGIDEDFLKLRAEAGLAQVKGKISKLQAKIWEYFPPRKLADLFYATNREGQGRPMERIFYDIDRSNMTAEQAQKVAGAFVEAIRSDRDFNKLVKYKIFVMWTGHSFHVYLMLSRPISPAFYSQHIHFSKEKPEASFTGRWAVQLKAELGINIGGGHEKVANRITLDPSQTPSGKLARAPFSLHMSDARTVDGVALPLKPSQLEEKGLVKQLQTYTPQNVIKELNRFSML